MAAAALARVNPSGRLFDITLVESELIGTVGVGEATIPAIRRFNILLGLDEREFMARTQATFKLGIKFIGWGHEPYIHPFGGFGVDLQSIRFHQLWLQLREEDPAAAGSLFDYAIAVTAAEAGKFNLPSPDANSVLSRMDYAFHFDAGLYARFLREKAEAGGVTRIEGLIDAVRQRAEDGFVESVVLKGGQIVEGDLFIDCSGFRGLLIEQTLKAGYEDWSHWLPCDSAVAMPSRSIEEPRPHTTSTAESAGWRWTIPLQHRVGNGYVYSSRHISDEDAQAVLRAAVPGEPIAEPRILRFTTGHRKKQWDRNVIAMGLASGFLEPLESTSIHLVQAAVTQLISLLPSGGDEAALSAIFNAEMLSQYEQVRDFLILHYKTGRAPGAFWDQCRAMDVPADLTRRLELFEAGGRLVDHEAELFGMRSWLSVMMGQDVEPRGHDPILNIIDPVAARRHIDAVRDVVQRATNALPTHQQFIDAYCPAKGV